LQEAKIRQAALIMLSTEMCFFMCENKAKIMPLNTNKIREISFFKKEILYLMKKFFA